MKRLSLYPYPVGAIHLCRTREEFYREYKRRTKQKCPFVIDSDRCGRFNKLTADSGRGDTVWLVYAKYAHVAAHEFAHVLLHACNEIGHDPTTGDGEPFCYLLSQLMLDAGFNNTAKDK